MKAIRSFAVFSGALLLAACANFPFSSSPDDSSWRLRSVVENGLDKNIRVYNFCYRGKENDFLGAREFEQGEHTLVARVIQRFNYVESKPLEAFAVLNGTFEGGRIYTFQQTIEKEKATIWIADAETGEPATEKATVNLAIGEVIDRDQRQYRRCKESTV